MSLMGCLGCDCEYEAGLARCPQCGTRSPMYQGTEGEDEMPKATSGGASNAAADLEAAGAEAEPSAPVEEAAPMAVLVGEPGPELVDLPAGDVVAAPKAARGRKAAPSAPDAPAEGE